MTFERNAEPSANCKVQTKRPLPFPSHEAGFPLCPANKCSLEAPCLTFYAWSNSHFQALRHRLWTARIQLSYSFFCWFCVNAKRSVWLLVMKTLWALLTTQVRKSEWPLLEIFWALECQITAEFHHKFEWLFLHFIFFLIEKDRKKDSWSFKTTLDK